MLQPQQRAEYATPQMTVWKVTVASSMLDESDTDGKGNGGGVLPSDPSEDDFDFDLIKEIVPEIA